MTTLLYRGQSYVQHKENKEHKDCVELTYRRNHYNTCRTNAKNEVKSHLAYRGQKYQHQFKQSLKKALPSGAFFNDCLLLLSQSSINAQRPLLKTQYIFIGITMTIKSMIICWQTNLRIITSKYSALTNQINKYVKAEKEYI